MMKKYKRLSIICGILFILAPLLSILEGYIRFGTTFFADSAAWSAYGLNLVMGIVIAIGIWKQNRILCSCVAGITTLISVLLLFTMNSNYLYQYDLEYATYLTVTDLIYAIANCLILGAFASKKGTSKVLGCIACIVFILPQIFQIVMGLTEGKIGAEGFYVNVGTWFFLFLSVRYALIGYSFSDIRKSAKKNVSARSQNNVSNEVNRLVNLKSLLDQGIITQEEFDVKKKEIMEQ